jgi:hypothetical protein
MFLIVYSDDILCSTLNEKARKLVTKKIADRFKIKILGNVKKYVGIEVVRLQQKWLYCYQSTNLRFGDA